MLKTFEVPARFIALTFAFVVGLSVLAIPAQSAQAYPPTSMGLRFETTSANEVAEFGFGGDLVGVTIDWGDGSSQVTVPNGTAVADALYSHTYTTVGTYSAVVTATKLTHFGYCGLPQNFWNLTQVLSWGSMQTTSFECALSNRSGLTSVPSTLPSSVTNLNLMFLSNHIFDQDLSGWNTHNVTAMRGTFRSAYSFNNGGAAMPWDTSHVTDMAQMFNGAEVFNQSLAGWDVSQVTDMTSMLDKVVGQTWAFSDQNYSSMLVGWAAQAVQPNLVLSASSNKATGCAAVEARAQLLASPHNWSFTDVAPTDVVPAGGCSGSSFSPSPSPSASGSSSPSASALAQTGAPVFIGLFGLSTAMLMAGVSALIVRRKLISESK